MNEVEILLSKYNQFPRHGLEAMGLAKRSTPLEWSEEQNENSYCKSNTARGKK